MDLVQNKVGSLCKLQSNIRLQKTRMESSDDRPYHLSPDWYLEVPHWIRSLLSCVEEVHDSLCLLILLHVR